jgi:hypothetical protein
LALSEEIDRQHACFLAQLTVNDALIKRRMDQCKILEKRLRAELALNITAAKLFSEIQCDLEILKRHLDDLSSSLDHSQANLEEAALHLVKLSGYRIDDKAVCQGELCRPSGTQVVGTLIGDCCLVTMCKPCLLFERQKCVAKASVTPLSG